MSSKEPSDKVIELNQKRKKPGDKVIEFKLEGKEPITPEQDEEDEFCKRMESFNALLSAGETFIEDISFLVENHGLEEEKKEWNKVVEKWEEMMDEVDDFWDKY